MSMLIKEIMEFLPHRYPMLLVDRIEEFEPGVRCVGLKNVSINEPFFQGHYPGLPIMPGVLLIEAMAQAGAVILLADEKYKGRIPIIGAIDNVKFKRPIVPGDQLRSEITLIWLKSGIGRIHCEGTVAGQLAVSLDMTFKLVENLA